MAKFGTLFVVCALLLIPQPTKAEGTAALKSHAISTPRTRLAYCAYAGGSCSSDNDCCAGSCNAQHKCTK